MFHSSVHIFLKIGVDSFLLVIKNNELVAVFCSKTNECEYLGSWNKFEVVCVSKMELKSIITSQSLYHLRCGVSHPLLLAASVVLLELSSLQGYAVGSSDLPGTPRHARSWTHLRLFCPAGRRKSATARAVVYEHGSGKIHVNGVDYLLYFPITQDRCGFHSCFEGKHAL